MSEEEIQVTVDEDNPVYFFSPVHPNLSFGISHEGQRLQMHFSSGLLRIESEGLAIEIDKLAKKLGIRYCSEKEMESIRMGALNIHPLLVSRGAVRDIDRVVPSSSHVDHSLSLLEKIKQEREATHTSKNEV